ncbi:MAG: bifunctional diaminohydroxyphosphoribosylaminopyrimidine deaminase/5-amino-6-(5-phosphoribosylamino)uracil reductase RibD [Rhizobiales bacterium]|nr:bifunctional diaminohydroxyphosphoribosylaminopyrimidine deaminase/5-amino-6-(5-phosphoribosylamino)uracil reductase RibD [Hyphomicrobiales bacterium]NRB12821.1 bifunctional diaminohydroxyphosphoribosylaminopyrimidine deaminase/5-amino-6-(5-phosphoribosylamino)uracil reductase RibD [Hyphomicrobiales bacterium]
MNKHKYYMQQAINLAADGIGNVGDNPSVGCVIVANDAIIGSGCTQKDGRHAETMAIADALENGHNLTGATAYVTLEPCAHFGRTPPCAQALVTAKISKIFIAVADPDPRVSGQGIKILQAAAITVETGLLEVQAKQGLLGFLSRIQTNRPYVMLKLAMSQDGYIVRADGTSKWITSEKSRNYSHNLRAKNDAILVGIETALADDPMLNCRQDGMQSRSPARVVLDSDLRLKLDSKLVTTAGQIPTLIMTIKNAKNQAKIAQLKIKKVQIHFVKQHQQYLDLTQVLNILSQHGINNLMIEGGAKTASSFIDQNLVDELNLFYAPEVIGQGGKLALRQGIANLLVAKTFTKISEMPIDCDRLEIWQRSLA